MLNHNTIGEKTMKSIVISAISRQDSNGNTYFSASVLIDGEEVITRKNQYGYGDHYVADAFEELASKGLIEDYAGQYYKWCQDHGVSLWTVMNKAATMKQVKDYQGGYWFSGKA